MKRLGALLAAAGCAVTAVLLLWAAGCQGDGEADGQTRRPADEQAPAAPATDTPAQTPADTMSPEARQTAKDGPKIHAACAACGFETPELRARDDDAAWPKACPKCSRRTVYRSKRCPFCTRYAVQQPDAKGKIHCKHCGKLLQDPAEEKYTDL